MINDIELSGEKVEEWQPSRKDCFIMITLALISLMAALDATILVSILPALSQDLKGTAIDTFWAATSYLLTSAVSQPLIATLSDVFGRRELLLTSLILFTIGSIVCGTSQDFTALLAGRSVQGVGGGGIITLVQVIFTDTVPLRQRPKWFSIVLMAWALGSAAGPLIGAIFIQKASFRWIFWINLPICGLGLVFASALTTLKAARTSLKRGLLSLDWICGFLFTSSTAIFLIGLSWGGVQYPWSSPYSFIPIICGPVGLGAAFFWERHSSREPFLRQSLFHEVSAVAAYICAFMQGLILFCALYYIPFYFASVHLHSPIASGINILPISCLLLPGSAVVSQLITRLGRYRWAIWVGWIVTTIGAGLLLLLGEGTTPRLWVPVFIVFGVGNGMVLSAVNFGIQAIVRTEDAGRAASTYTFMRSLGMAIGVAIGGNVFQNQMSHKLRDLGLPVIIARDAEGYVAVLRTLEESNRARIGAIQAYVYGFKSMFALLTGTSAAGLLVSCFIKSYCMDKVLKSKYTVET